MSDKTQHLCVDGKWRKGRVEDCPKHKKITKRQSVPGAKAV